MIVTTGTVIQIVASIREIMPLGSSIRNGMGLDSNPSDRRALLTRPTVALKNQANWNPISTGANIIGIIRSVRAGPDHERHPRHHQGHSEADEQ